MIIPSTPKDELIHQLELEFDYEEDLYEDDYLFDWDGDALASAGFGTDEDYGGY